MTVVIMESVTKYVVILLIFCIKLLHVNADLSNEENVPVMIWSDEVLTGLINPLKKISKPEFQQILEKKFRKVHPPIIVFVLKDNLCTEDIKQYEEVIFMK